MARYKMCGGLAITPERELKLLKDMSKKGWHLVGMRGLGFLYRFDKGEPCDYDYAINMEKEIDQDMLLYYEASGWCPVVIGPGIQIFRAMAGTVPLFSDKESQVEVLERNQKMSGKWSGIFGILLIAWFITTSLIDLGILTVIVMITLITCFIFTLFPFLGLSKSLKKLR